jgi:hypothetical protein
MVIPIGTSTRPVYSDLAHEAKIFVPAFFFDPT